MNNASLQNEFLKGTPPEALDGYFTGELVTLFPKSVLEVMGGMMLHVWLPWKGKYFYSQNHMGDNVLPTYLISAMRFWFRDPSLTAAPDGRLHAFPFRTSIRNGLQDPISVLQLDYDLAQNPPLVRRVVDELVCVGANVYLGKAYLKEKNHYRLGGYFRLKKEQ